MEYNDILQQITYYEDVLLKENLSTAKFEENFSRILNLRKNYKLDINGQFMEVYQFLYFLKALIIKKEKYMSNTTFDVVVKKMISLHKEFTSENYKELFLDRELLFLEDIKTEINNKPHTKTIQRLNHLCKATKILKEDQNNNSFGC